ncbi:PDDEXK nuclease domain-containing protein [Riemerella columbipharyngis]|uniref:Predicted nuclease of restriction endonuclease-like (RecB) superfamily, DUF1016 family n=1 Tax=Riemerella columbipharyngis TaxID=1071918 RepID=A0A1G7F6Z0_9FLAO|nr:PDDEXK nuclease domain-containing protein [Riemerella columbipharyngis]SDE71566.1 Predicted nuclease of restriction endonuclease-like (RecB) superfamily, DUF1016 family [Riemerella columbipharyngis]
MKTLQIKFNDIIHLIQKSRINAIKAVNKELINLYWNIGEYISIKIEQSEWGQGVVSELSNFIQNNHPELKGFSDKNLWRMKQFYETYKDFPKLSTLLREISWSNNILIFSRCKTLEEREFYLKLSSKEKYSYRELDRQISASTFERTMIASSHLPITLKENTNIKGVFKDSYILDFLNISEHHSESDLQKNLVHQMKDFILELGKDFLFIGEEYRIQVGNSDFFH